jgi:hypothetical protein
MPDDAVRIRTLDDIMKEARNNFAMTKDKKKMEKDSTKYGQLRPIYTSLVNEIRAEEAEKQRIRDEREENEVESLESDGAGGKQHRPSRITQNVRKRKASQRPHSAAAGTGHRSSIQGGGHRNSALHGSQEAPAKLQGDRATILSRASQHNIDPHTGQPTNRRQELVPVRSVEVLAINTLESEMDNNAHGRISRTQKELMQHINKSQQQAEPTHLPPLHNNKGIVRPAPIHTGAHNKSGATGNSAEKSTAEPVLDNFAASPSSGKFRTAVKDGGVPLGVKFAPTPSFHAPPEDDHESWDAERAAENLARTLKLTQGGKSGKNSPEKARELSEKELTPSQMLLQAQQRSAYGEFGDDNNGGVRSLVALREQASSKRSSFFSASAVQGDEKISRAQLQRDEILKVSSSSGSFRCQLLWC